MYSLSTVRFAFRPRRFASLNLGGTFRRCSTISRRNCSLTQKCISLMFRVLGNIFYLSPEYNSKGFVRFSWTHPIRAQKLHISLIFDFLLDKLFNDLQRLFTWRSGCLVALCLIDHTLRSIADSFSSLCSHLRHKLWIKYMSDSFEYQS